MREKTIQLVEIVDKYESLKPPKISAGQIKSYEIRFFHKTFAFINK